VCFNSTCPLFNMVSKRIEPNLAPSPLFDYMSRALKNAYHPNDNPQGIITLGIAENTVMNADLATFLSTHMEIKSTMFGYGSVSPGPPSLKAGLVRMYNAEPFNSIVPVESDQIHLAGGCSALLDQIMWTLCDEGEGVLVGKPLYGGFISDMQLRAKLKPIAVSLKGVDPFSVEAVARYEQELIKARINGIKVRMLVLCTPHNPLGQ
jgi:1-aminocyclopropane-1-carboxylate synthase